MFDAQLPYIVNLSHAFETNILSVLLQETKQNHLS